MPEFARIQENAKKYMQEIAMSAVLNFYLQKHEENGGRLAHRTYKTEISTRDKNPSHGQPSYAKKQKIVTYQLFDPTPSEATEWFIEELMKILQENNIVIKKVSSIPNSDDNLILVCNRSSRLVTDVERSLRAVARTDYNRILLVALHVKEEYALPEESTKQHLLYEDEKYRDLLGIVDIAFTTENGIYSCRMNDTAKQAIMNL
ncbi:uncharacterized protein LOC128559136 [Mercenaria mercenaria]|uniref:uncharacterized protein LOC128559136 n=1 Tax=Mercenaria mercenaria TaxID=6596 RepID=UPI00234F139D|nr:uncharacterized protein LOC128559136 [Mercenaria mercenaria]